MTPEKIEEAFDDCACLITNITDYEVPGRMPAEETVHLEEPGSEYGRAMGHLLFCCEEGVCLAKQGRTEKAFRWLGFVQGAIWAAGLAPLEVLKQMNRVETEVNQESACGV